MQPLRGLFDEDFCSREHRERYHVYFRRALERLPQPEAASPHPVGLADFRSQEPRAQQAVAQPRRSSPPWDHSAALSLPSLPRLPANPLLEADSLSRWFPEPLPPGELHPETKAEAEVFWHGLLRMDGLHDWLPQTGTEARIPAVQAPEHLPLRPVDSAIEGARAQEEPFEESAGLAVRDLEAQVKAGLLLSEALATSQASFREPLPARTVEVIEPAAPPTRLPDSHAPPQASPALPSALAAEPAPQFQGLASNPVAAAVPHLARATALSLPVFMPSRQPIPTEEEQGASAEQDGPLPELAFHAGEDSWVSWELPQSGVEVRAETDAAVPPLGPQLVERSPEADSPDFAPVPEIAALARPEQEPSAIRLADTGSGDDVGLELAAASAMPSLPDFSPSLNSPAVPPPIREQLADQPAALPVQREVAPADRDLAPVDWQIPATEVPYGSKLEPGIPALAGEMTPGLPVAQDDGGQSGGEAGLGSPLAPAFGISARIKNWRLRITFARPA